MAPKYKTQNIMNDTTTNTNFLDVINGKESLKFELQIETKSIITLCLALMVTALVIISVAKR